MTNARRPEALTPPKRPETDRADPASRGEGAHYGTASRRQGRFHGRVDTPAPRCDEPGCETPGEFRAPLSPAGFDGPGRWRLLCLDHVRAFNQGYNFFAGMDADAIAAAQTPVAGWARATRAFSHLGGGLPPKWADFTDPLDTLGTRFRARPRRQRRDGRPVSDEDARAFAVMGLDIDADRRALRRAYLDLVRRYHPDRNGGDRTCEKALRNVIAAYTQLKSAPAFA